MESQICPDNLIDIEKFLNFREKVFQNKPDTLRVRRHELHHLISWAADRPFPDVSSIEISFPVYLLTARNDGKNIPLSPASLAKICDGARLFFDWAKREEPDRYRQISENWIQSLRPRRASGMQSRLKKHEYWTLEEVLSIARLKLTHIGDIRDQAAICFLYLSGMRLTAFATLSIDCIDISRRRIEQLPEKGVITKNNKAAVTTLLNIPELLAIVENWDNKVRSSLSSRCLWYARLSDPSPSTGEEPQLIPTDSTPLGRRNALYKGLHRLCKMAGIPYHSPHKLRHGNTVYGVKNAKNMQELKAVSQNLMHSSIAITDGIYGNLTEEDVIDTIASLGKTPAQPAGDMDFLYKAILAKLQANPALLQTILDA
jgi:integrase